MITLHNGKTKAEVDLNGAWMTTLQDNEGDILFPKSALTLDDGTIKQRGGCHVCLPNFGPGGSSGQPQHGFGRQVEWRIQQLTDITATLTLEGGEGGYDQLRSTLQYELQERTLAMSLRVTNVGTDDLRLAPAFHPYFALAAGEETVYVNDRLQRTNQLEETTFVTADHMTFQTAGRYVTLASRQLPVWAEWTDNLGPYVCIEPTLGGYMFLQETPTISEILAGGKTKAYHFLVQW